MADLSSAPSWPPRSEGAVDPLLAAFRELARLLEQPVGDAELHAAGPWPARGAALGDLRRLAGRLGFATRVSRVNRSSLRQVSLPCLAIGRREGEVWLLTGRDGKNLVLEDVARGIRSVLTPPGAARVIRRLVEMRRRERRADEPAPTASFWRRALARRLMPVAVEVVTASVVVNLTALAMPLFTMAVYNKVIGHAAIGTLHVLAVGMAALLVFEILLRALRGYVAGHTAARLDAALGSELTHHLLRMPWRVFERMPAGQIMERLRQLEPVRQFFAGQMPLVLIDLVFSVIFLAATLVIAPLLGLITAAAVPAYLLVAWLAQARQRVHLREHFRAMAQRSATLAEAVQNALTIKALGLEPEVEQRFQQRLGESAATGFRAGHVATLVGSLGLGLQHVVALAIIWAGAHQVIAGELSVGALVAASILAARALAPLRQVFGAWRELQAVREAFARLDALMAEAAEAETGRAIGDLPLDGRLRVQEVSFAYAPNAPPALADVSLEVGPGEILGITGPPGSGKSTLVRLLLGLDRPQAGHVLVDDIDVATLPPSAWRAQLGVVPQEIQLFAGTIAENIAMGSADRSLARVVAAARFTGLAEIVQRLPDGYETLLGERGAGLSSGQRQLVAIARAIIRNPRILILDEATSALDAASEEYLLANLKRASAGRVVILVTHRIPVLAICDKVALLERGRLERLGTPQEIVGHLRERPRRASLQAVG